MTMTNTENKTKLCLFN